MTTLTKSQIREVRAAEALCETVPSVLQRQGFGEDVCILATRLAVDACHQNGIKAGPLACEVVALSPELAEHLDAGFPWSQHSPGWSVGIGWKNQTVLTPESMSPGYNGHLVAILNNRLIVDLSIGQVSRPKHDLIVEPFLHEVAPEFLEGKDLLTVRFDNGTTAMYTPRPERRDFFSAPDWAQTLKRYPKIVKEIRRAVASACN